MLQWTMDWTLCLMRTACLTFCALSWPWYALPSWMRTSSVTPTSWAKPATLCPVSDQVGGGVCGGDYNEIGCSWVDRLECGSEWVGLISEDRDCPCFDSVRWYPCFHCPNLEVGVGWLCCCPGIVWEPMQTPAHKQLVREHLATVILARWATLA